MLRLFLLITLTLSAYCAPYYVYDYDRPLYYPPSVPIGDPRYNNYHFQYYNYGYSPPYYNPIGTGSPWANGGGLVGNTIAFFVG